jgi:PAP2 superfamily
MGTSQTPDLEPRRRAAVVAREAILVAAAIVSYFGIRNATAGNLDESFENADRIVRVERALDVAWERGIQSSIIRSDDLVALANWVYIWGHWPVILATALALLLFRRDRYYLLRNALFVSGAIGFLLFALFPVAPPRLLDLGLVDTVTEQSHAYRALQPPGLTNQYAAFPSLHVGWNLLVGIVLFGTTANLALRVFAVASPLAMTFAVVATANHFVVDVAAGVVVVVMGLAAARLIESSRSRATLTRSAGREAIAAGRPDRRPVRRRASGRQRARSPARVGGRGPRVRRG